MGRIKYFASMDYEKFMRRCLFLAEQGKIGTSPNPMVGCVIVHSNEIIGEGYHQKCGEAHAEVNAINSVANPALLKESTLFVTLEPCSHHGKTPPCADLITAKEIPHVVIACQDDFQKVNGHGIKKLKSAGVKVEVGVLEKEAKFLNRRFFTFHNQQRPYIILKWAESSNGCMDVDRSQEKHSGQFHITGTETQVINHQWRAEEDGILVGYKTVLNDNPSLTTRAYPGPNPSVLVIDPHDKITTDYHLKQSAHSHFYTHSYFEDKGEKNDTPLNFIKAVLKDAHQKNIQSLIIEGGKSTLEHFIAHQLFDEIRVLKGSSSIKNGIPAPKIPHHINSMFKKTLAHGESAHYYFYQA